MENDNCPFCHPEEERQVLRVGRALAIWDSNPVSPGHMLIIPEDHEEDFFQIPSDTMRDMMQLLILCQEILKREFQPDGFNIGLNLGTSAGQTVGHIHIHMIPRYDGDVPDPRGGIRGVIPEKRTY